VRKERNLNPGFLKAEQSLPGDPLVRVKHTDKHLPDLILDYQFRTAP